MAPTSIPVPIAIIGSINMDLVGRTPRLPRPGETVLGRELSTIPGGKGANQAVAAARAGGQVTMIGLVGNDIFGDQLVQSLASDGVNVNYIGRSHQSSGVALILVDDDGENCITFIPGANFDLTAEHVDAALPALADAKFVLVQLEIDPATVAYGIKTAARVGARVILDPAPAPLSPLPADLWPAVDVLVPNLHEARALIEDAGASEDECVRRLARSGIRGAVIVTLGAQGVAWATASDPDRIHYQPAFPIKPVDGTGAGDAFAGALAVALGEGRSLEQAITFAQAAGALAATRAGAQTSLAFRSEIEAFMAAQGGGPGGGQG